MLKVKQVKIDKLKRVSFPSDDFKKDIQKMIRELNDLLQDFDGETLLSEDDSNIIQTEYQEILEKAYEQIESILHQE